MKKTLTLAFLLIISIGWAAAQTQISGTVVDDKNDPLIGATVQIKGTSRGTVTDYNGNFTLSVPENAYLIITYVGMATQELQAKANMRIVLAPDSEELQELVVTGYGVNRKAAFTGAATTVGKKELSERYNTNPIKALEGNVPGLQLSTSSGQPGAPSTIFIRGRNSLNSGTQPLYVIDGVPFMSDSQGMRSGESQVISPLSSINPDDIESVTVLKDATATSIYGARAANGVVVITTKKGTQGVFKVNLTSRFGVEKMPIIPKAYRLLNADKYRELSTEGLINDYNIFKEKSGIVRYNAMYFGNKLTYDTEGMNTFLDAWTDAVKGADVNWLDEVTRDGFIQQYNLDIQSGGASKYAAKYFLSLDYLDNKAIVRGKDMSRVGFRLNMDQSPTDMISFGFNLNFSYTKINMGAGGGYFSDPITQATMHAPVYGPKDEDGGWNFNTINGYNPVAQRSELGDKSLAKQYRAIFSPFLQVNLTPDLFFRTKLGVDAYFLDEFGYWSFLQPQGKDMRGMGENGYSTNTLLTLTNTLNYIKKYGEFHNVNFLLGQEVQKNNLKDGYLSGSNYAVDYLNEVSLASVPSSASTYQQELILQSYFSNLQYDFANKYYLSASLRFDQSSRFGKNNAWGSFWSVGGKYRISEEKFMERTSDWLSSLMIRSSYGTTGNQAVGGNWYAARNLYAFGANYNQQPGSYHSQFGNPDLKWEYTAKFNVGMDISLFDRLLITADYYKHNTKDMVFSVPVSMTTGLTQYPKNIGELSNEGFELAISANILKTTDFKWDITLSASHNKNKVIKLSTDNPIESATTIIEAGRDIYTFKMKEWAGVDPQTGRGLWYLNETGDETTQNYNAAKKRYLGSASPKFQGGISNHLSWKGIDFSFQLTASLGNKIYGNNLRYLEHTGGAFPNNFSEYVYDNRWTSPGQKAAVPQLIVFDGNRFKENQASSRYLMDGSYVKIRTISLGYSLPNEMTQRVGIKNLRLFINAENIYTFHKKNYRGFDPSTIGADGIQWWNYPVPRTFICGLTLGF